MPESLPHGDTAFWVEGDHPCHQVECYYIEVFEVEAGVDCFELREGCFHVWQLTWVIGSVTDIAPLLMGGGAVELENFEDLVDFTVPAEQRPLLC